MDDLTTDNIDEQDEGGSTLQSVLDVINTGLSIGGKVYTMTNPPAGYHYDPAANTLVANPQTQYITIGMLILAAYAVKKLLLD